MPSRNSMRTNRWRLLPGLPRLILISAVAWPLTCRCVGPQLWSGRAGAGNLPRFIFLRMQATTRCLRLLRRSGNGQAWPLRAWVLSRDSWRRGCGAARVNWQQGSVRWQQGCDVNSIPTDKIAVTQNANVAVMAGAILMCCACMWVVSHTSSLPLAMIAAIGFGLFSNTLFSLMHEAVHGMFHGKRSVNEFAGFVAAAFFPTIFPIQRLSHMTHHKNNRSSVERFDYYEADDFHFLKVAQWYSILTGLYWLFIPVFATVYALFGNLIPWQKLVATDGTLGRQTSAKPYFESLQLIPMWRIRLGFALTLCVQALMIWGLDLSLWGWGACYAVFGLMWSSLQYADHAFSPLDNIKGTWNLRVNGLVRLAYL